MPNTNPKKWTPNPKQRDELAEWPAGEERTTDKIVNLHFSNYRPESGNRAVTEGYLEPAGTKKLKHPTSSYSYERENFKRTDKPMKPYRRRGPSVKKRAYSGIFPWSVNEHWQRIETSPARIACVFAHKLTEKHKFNASRRTYGDKVANPMHITTPAQLTSARAMLAALFGFQPEKTYTRIQKRQKNILNNTYGIPGELESLMFTGVGIRILLLEMLVEPEFDAVSNEFVGFKALDPDKAGDEAAVLNGVGLTVREKYDRYMEESAWAPA